MIDQRSVLARCAQWALVLSFAMMQFACSEATPTITRVSTLIIPTDSPRPTLTFTASAIPSVTPSLSRPVHIATAIPSIVPTDTPTPVPSATLIPATATPACTEVTGRIEKGAFYSEIIGREQPYRVYLPPCYDYADEVYPVLYMLHGYPFDDAHWDEIGIDEAADRGIADGTLPPFIIAMPAADNEGTYTKTSGGTQSFEGVLLGEFIPFVEENYRASRLAEERAIGGMSRGAVWSLEIAFRNPNLFSAVGGHSAALNVNSSPPVYDPIYLAADPAIRDLRIFLDVGQGDWVIPGMEELHGALTAAGVVHDYYIFEGFHDDGYWATHAAKYLAFYATDW